MSEMEERVARALHRSADGRSQPGFRVLWEDCLPAYREMLLADASAAIEEMRVPTQEMLEADPGSSTTHMPTWKAAMWRAMLDAALAPRAA